MSRVRSPIASSVGGRPSWRWRLLNALALIALVVVLWAIITHVPAYRGFMDTCRHLTWGGQDYLSWTARELEGWAALVYGTIYGVWYLITGGSGPGKVVRFWSVVWRLARQPLVFRPDSLDRLAALNVSVKIVFIPLVTVWLAGNGSDFVCALDEAVHHAGLTPWLEWWWRYAHMTVFWFLLLIDVVCFYIGYLVEHRRLGNEIVSVEPTLIGWAFTIICYPPLNGWTGDMLGWFAHDQPQVTQMFGFSPSTQIVAVALSLLSLTGMTIYAWASIALGLRASNLTNRGIVTHGPYAWVRHPAYAGKNAAWMISALVPLALMIDRGNLLLALGVVASSAAWAFVYHLRAVTEERHLGADPAYQAYCRRVTRRYIPAFLVPSRQSLPARHP